MNKKVQRFLGRTMTVGQLRELLDGYEDDMPVAFTTDYGDYGHTQQCHELGEAHVAPVHQLAESAYSHSGVAYVDDLEGERAYCGYCDKERDWAAKCPKCGNPMIDEEGDTIEASDADDTDGPTEVLIFMT